MSAAISEFQPLTVMLSSRCKDTFLWQGKQQPLSELRKAIKAAVEDIKFADKQLFEIKIFAVKSTLVVMRAAC